MFEVNLIHKECEVIVTLVETSTIWGIMSSLSTEHNAVIVGLKILCNHVIDHASQAINQVLSIQMASSSRIFACS